MSMICWTVCSRLVPATRFDAACPYTSPVPLHNHRTLVGFHSRQDESSIWFSIGYNATQKKILAEDFCSSKKCYKLLFILHSWPCINGVIRIILTVELQQLVQGQMQGQGQVLCCRKSLLNTYTGKFHNTNPKCETKMLLGWWDHKHCTAVPDLVSDSCPSSKVDIWAGEVKSIGEETCQAKDHPSPWPKTKHSTSTYDLTAQSCKTRKDTGFCEAVTTHREGAGWAGAAGVAGVWTGGGWTAADAWYQPKFRPGFNQSHLQNHKPQQKKGLSSRCYFSLTQHKNGKKTHLCSSWWGWSCGCWCLCLETTLCHVSWWTLQIIIISIVLPQSLSSYQPWTNLANHCWEIDTRVIHTDLHWC